MQRNAFLKYVCIVVCVYAIAVPMAFSQDVKTGPKVSNKNFSFAIGYQYLFWGYDLARRSRTGALKVIHQASQYHGLVFSTKFRALRPWGLFSNINIYFPFSIEESMYFAQNKVENKTQVIKDGVYLLKNIPVKDVLKGIGITTALGANYTFEKDAHMGNIGLGLSWITFVEDMYGKNKQNRTSSMLGFILDGSYQFNFSKIFGISIGTNIAYYPIPLFSLNNLVGAYSIKTTSMVEYSINIAPVFYF